MKVYIMVGVAGAGKDTYIREHLKDTEVISSDDIRMEYYGEYRQDRNEEVFAVAHKRLLNALKGTKDITFNATNLNRKRRSHLYNNIKEYAKQNNISVEVEILMLLRSLKTLKEHNDKREEAKRVGEEVIERMYINLQPPRAGVDCDTFKIVTSNDFSKEYEEDKPHNSPHHKETIKEHIQMVIEEAKKDRSNLRDRLIESARYHDNGKFVARKELAEGFCTYKNHANLSAIYYLSKENVDIQVLECIYQHMNAHGGLTDRVIRRNKLTEEEIRLIKAFQEIDNRGRLWYKS